VLTSLAPQGEIGSALEPALERWLRLLSACLASQYRIAYILACSKYPLTMGRLGCIVESAHRGPAGPERPVMKADELQMFVFPSHCTGSAVLPVLCVSYYLALMHDNTTQVASELRCLSRARPLTGPTIALPAVSLRVLLFLGSRHCILFLAPTSLLLSCGWSQIRDHFTYVPPIK
jgi:hypothetical protein